MDLQRRAVGCSRRAFWGLGYPEYGPERRPQSLNGHAFFGPWVICTIRSGQSKRGSEGGILKYKAQGRSPFTKNNTVYGNPGKITKARGGEAGSGKVSWRRKCPNPIFSSRGSICCKLEVHDIIDLMSLEIK